jgi:hypothetical protein
MDAEGKVWSRIVVLAKLDTTRYAAIDVLMGLGYLTTGSVHVLGRRVINKRPDDGLEVFLAGSMV